MLEALRQSAWNRALVALAMLVSVSLSVFASPSNPLMDETTALIHQSICGSADRPGEAGGSLPQAPDCPDHMAWCCASGQVFALVPVFDASVVTDFALAQHGLRIRASLVLAAPRIRALEAQRGPPVVV